MRVRLGAIVIVAMFASIPIAEAVTYGSSQAIGGNPPTLSRAVSKPAGTLAGHLLVAHVAAERGADLIITPPDGWVLLARENYGSDLASAVYTRIASSEEPATYTWSYSQGVRNAIGILRYIDVDTTRVTDGTAGAAQADALTLTLPSVTTSEVDSRLVVLAGIVRSTSFTPAPGMTERYAQQGGITIHAADEPLPSAGATATKTVTVAKGDKMIGHVVALRKAPTPTVSLDRAASASPESAGVTRFWANLSAPSQLEAMVDYAVTGTASGNGVDHALASGTLTYAPGDVSKEIVAPITDDAAVEPDETLVVTLSNFRDLAQGTHASVTHTILNDDGVVIAFASASSAASESAGTVALNVSLSGASPEPIEVPYGAAGGTSSYGTDHTLVEGMLRFAPGETMRTIDVPIVADDVYEAGETLVVALGQPSFGELGPVSTHVLTILDDDAQPPTIAFVTSASSASEAAGSAPISVVLAPAAAAEVTVAYDVTGGTATSGSDFALAPGRLVFAPGETMRTITLQILADIAPEASETVIITLSNATGALLGPSEHIFTILDDDATLPRVRWSAEASTASEASGTASVVATLSSSATTAVSVAYAVTGGTATGEGVDHTLGAGTLTFAPGETTKALNVGIVDDAAIEGDETIVLTLSDPNGATLGSWTTHTLTILDNDVPAQTRIDVADQPVLPDGSPHADATWGGWTAEAGARDIASTNFLKLVNTGAAPTPSVVISFASTGFVGITDPSFNVPAQGNIQFAWWEDATPETSSPNEGSFVFGATAQSAAVTLHFTGTGRVIYVAYRIVAMPDVLLDQPYDGSYTVTEL